MRQPSSAPAAERVPLARLTLHYTDPITGNDEALYTLFYEE